MKDNQWIKFSEKNPPAYQNVLITDGIDVGTSTIEFLLLTNTLKNMTHWMTYPNLPKKDET